VLGADLLSRSPKWQNAIGAKPAGDMLMNERDRALRTRGRLLSKLPVTGEILRGSLLKRRIFHRDRGRCSKCARGEGHVVFVLTVSHGPGRTRQFSVRREMVADVRRWLSNYQKLKKAIEVICQLNHAFLRPQQRQFFHK